VSAGPGPEGSPPAGRFSEVQRFRQPVLLAFVGLAAALQWALVVYYLVLGRSFGDEPPSNLAVLLPWALLGVALPLAVWRLRLVTEVSPSGVRIALEPFSRRHIAPAEIDGCRVVRYRPLRDFGGWGARWASGGRRAYSTGGRTGVEVDLRDGTQVVLGSRRPEELAEAIGALAQQ